MKAIYIIIPLFISLLSFEKDNCAMDSIKTSLDPINTLQYYYRHVYIITIIGVIYK